MRFPRTSGCNYYRCEIPIQESVHAWSFRSEVTDGLRWSVLLNTAPPAIDLSNGFLFRIRTREENAYSGGMGGFAASVFRYSIIGLVWLKSGYGLILNKSGNIESHF